jgi:hypothetical protein
MAGAFCLQLNELDSHSVPALHAVIRTILEVVREDLSVYEKSQADVQRWESIEEDQRVAIEAAHADFLLDSGG